MSATNVDALSRLGEFDYFTTEIGSLKPRWKEQKRGDGSTKRVVQAVEHDGQTFEVTDRFFRSLCSRFHFGGSMFRYFEPSEVFERIQEVHGMSGESRIRIAVEGAKLWGASNPKKPVVMPYMIHDALNEAGGDIINSSYAGGILKTTHKMDEQWAIQGDSYQQTFTLETPLDGYGLPAIYLSLIRMVCSNGMIGYAPAFRSEIQLGREKDLPTISLVRALSAFNNEEGFQSLRQRLEAAQNSWASVYEVMRLEERLYKSMGVNAFLHGDITEIKNTGSFQVIMALHKMAGSICDKYQVGSPEAISTKKQHLLPMNCTVYNLFNFATEVTTHHSDLLKEARQIHGWIGTMVCNEYDLEGSVEDAQQQYVQNDRAFVVDND